jgi:GT2 family glycosyltransferase
MNNPNLIKPKYSIFFLIYHHNQKLVDMALNCAAAVRNSSYDYELTIIDNGSTFRYSWEKECNRYIRLDQNMGISHGWNLGVKTARGKYLVCIGDDVIVHRGWLEAMEEGIKMPDAGACNPHVEHLPGGMGIVENYKWPSGACWLTTPEIINKVGLFDEDRFFPGNFEDIDFWCRLYKHGYKLYTNFHLTVQHLEGQTLHGLDLTESDRKNKQAFIDKWHFDPIPVFFGNAPMPKL